MNENYGADPWREPKQDEDDTVIFSEHGRVLDKTDYRSHWLMLVEEPYQTLTLLVKHGGGQERIRLGYHTRYWKQVAQSMQPMDSDGRYLMLYALYRLYRETRRQAEDRVRAEMKLAFVEGRLKKRKVRGQNAYKVTVERKIEGVRA